MLRYPVVYLIPCNVPHFDKDMDMNATVSVVIRCGYMQLHHLQLIKK